MDDRQYRDFMDAKRREHAYLADKRGAKAYRDEKIDRDLRHRETEQRSRSKGNAIVARDAATSLTLKPVKAAPPRAAATPPRAAAKTPPRPTTAIEEREFLCIFDRPASAELNPSGVRCLCDLAAVAARKRAVALRSEGWQLAEDLQSSKLIGRLRIIKREKQRLRQYITVDAVSVTFRRSATLR
jgi:hypothetical protein